MPRTVGVLGGMGPMAGAVFAELVVELTPARTDQEHVPLILINDPTIPDRTAFLLGSAVESPLPRLIEIARKLEAMGAELIAIPCNTAHIFWSRIARSVSVPVLNIIDETARRIEEQDGGPQIGLLATRGTVRTGVYETGLDLKRHSLILPSDQLQAQVQSIIEAVKANQDRRMLATKLLEVVGRLKDEGADRVILGCTELSLIRPDEPPLPLVDSLRILAEATVEQALLA